jgi:hypothetical protein
MPKSVALPVGRPSARDGWQSWASLATLVLVSLATLVGGIACLWVHARASAPEHFLVPAGVVGLASFWVQLRVFITAWRQRHFATHGGPLGKIGFWRRLFAGAFIAYVAALAVGPRPGVGSAWLSAVAAWYTFLLLPLAAPPRVLDGWRKWLQDRTPRRLSWLVCASMLLLVCGEAGLRAHKFARVQGWFLRSHEVALAEQVDLSVPAADLQNVWESRVTRLRAGPFRVAILGDEAVLDGMASSGYLARVQEMLPGLELVPLAARRLWSCDPADDVTSRLASCRPDLALAVVSIGEDLSYEPAGFTWFDWRQLELVQCIAGQTPAAANGWDEAPSAAHGADFEAFLGRLAPQLAACRSPIDAATRARWQRTFLSLDHVLAHCRDQQVPLALVLVPGEFQVNRALCDTLVRRLGCTSQQFDVELPQRRLAGFAEHRQLPVLDLLPQLRLCRQSLYQPNATAWNEQGSAAAASAIGGWLQSRYGGELELAGQLSIVR